MGQNAFDTVVGITNPTSHVSDVLPLNSSTMTTSLQINVQIFCPGRVPSRLLPCCLVSTCSSNAIPTMPLSSDDDDDDEWLGVT